MIPKLNPLVEEIPEALSIYINQIVYDKKSKGERVYTFSLGEAFFDIPRFVIDDEAFKRGYHYSSSMGQPSLRKCIVDMYHNSYGVSINWEDEILVSAGSKTIIYMVMRTILKPGEEVLVYEPAWLSYKEQIKLAGGVYVSIPYYENVIDWERYITEKTKLIIINNPNNPSGKLYSKEELEFLLKLAKKHDLFIMADEAYSDFLPEGSDFYSFAGVDENKEHCLVVNSLSKNMGLSGWRVGYAICHKDVLKQLLKLNQHLITCTGTVLQDYIADHFNDILAATVPQAKEMARKRVEVQKIMDRLGLKPLNGIGTLYFLLDVSKFKGTTDELVYDLLINHNIATVPGAAYGSSTKDFIRFGIGVESLEDIEMCLRKIKEFLEMEIYNAAAIDAEMIRRGIAVN